MPKEQKRGCRGRASQGVIHPRTSRPRKAGGRPCPSMRRSALHRPWPVVPVRTPRRRPVRCVSDRRDVPGPRRSDTAIPSLQDRCHLPHGLQHRPGCRQAPEPRNPWPVRWSEIFFPQLFSISHINYSVDLVLQIVYRFRDEISTVGNRGDWFRTGRRQTAGPAPCTEVIHPRQKKPGLGASPVCQQKNKLSQQVFLVQCCSGVKRSIQERHEGGKSHGRGHL